MAGVAARSDNIAGAIGLVLGFAAIIPFIEAAVKTLGEAGMAAPQIALFRFATQVVVIGALAFVWNGARIGRVPGPLWVFVLRGLCVTAGSAFLYAGLAVMPMADSSAIFFIEPLLLTAFSALLLGEAVGWRRWSAVAIGFAGAVLIVGPNFSAVGWSASLPALAAVCFAGAVLLTRRYAAHGRALTFQLTTALTAVTVLGAAIAVGTWLDVPAFTLRWPVGVEVELLLIVGLLSTCTNLMLTQAFRIAPASTIAPFLYLEIVGAVIVGFIVFGDQPTWQMWVGGGVVVGAGLVVWWREQVRGRPPGRPAQSKA